MVVPQKSRPRGTFWSLSKSVTFTIIITFYADCSWLLVCVVLQYLHSNILPVNIYNTLIFFSIKLASCKITLHFKSIYPSIRVSINNSKIPSLSFQMQYAVFIQHSLFFCIMVQKSCLKFLALITTIQYIIITSTSLPIWTLCLFYFIFYFCKWSNLSEYI